MRLPPLRSLQAFEAAARSSSFIDAAQELNVTPAAISHQIKTLEAHLGVELFHRLARGVEPTAAARELLPDVAKGFSHFGRAIGAVSGGTLAGRLAVSTMPSFAALWLVPRLGSFLDAFPEVDFRCRSSPIPADLHRGEADLRIPFGRGHYPGFVTRLLMTDSVFPVCAPTLLNRRPLRSVADLRHHVLLQDIAETRSEPPESWARWLRGVGAASALSSRLVEFNDSFLITEAAVQGQGVALGRMSLVREHLGTGRLVRPLKLSLPSEYAYYTVTTEAGAETPRVKAFLRWIEDEVARDTAERMP